MHYPAIALPVESYKDFECPPKHQARLNQCLRDTQAILTIGWRATEKPFLRLMAENVPKRGKALKVVIVDVAPENQTYDNLQAEGVALDAEVTYYDKGFSNFVTQERIVNLLFKDS